MPHKKRPVKTSKELRAGSGLTKLLAYLGQEGKLSRKWPLFSVEYATNNTNVPPERKPAKSKKVIGARPVPKSKSKPKAKDNREDSESKVGEEKVEENSKDSPMEIEDANESSSKKDNSHKSSSKHEEVKTVTAVPVANPPPQTTTIQNSAHNEEQSLIISMLHKPTHKTVVMEGKKPSPPFRRCCTHIAIAYYVQFTRQPATEASSEKKAQTNTVPERNDQHMTDVTAHQELASKVSM